MREALKLIADIASGSTTANSLQNIAKIAQEALAQPEQEPVAMKFKIYKPTVPDPVRQDINNALLPWVYDQDRSSGFDASMWVTPVATLTPQRKPWVSLSDEDIERIAKKARSKDHAITLAIREFKEKNT